MKPPSYFIPEGGLPPQSQMLSGKAVFKTAYAVIPKGVMTDIVTSALPHWKGERAWILARPMSGFSETFSQMLIELSPNGGSNRPEFDPEAESVVFVTSGTMTLTIHGQVNPLRPGSYAYLPPGCDWTLRNTGDAVASFHWIRKRYERVEGIEVPESFVDHDSDHAPVAMTGTEGAWATTRFVDPVDMRHDMHVNIVTINPGALIPFMETHVMEHGLFVLQGRGIYRLNEDWVEVEAGDFMWLRAFCPQACYATGSEPFRYLLYKDVNRLPRLSP